MKGALMKSIAYSYARQHLADTMKSVCADHDPVIVTSKNDMAVVVMSLADYEALQETAYLTSSPRNTKRLLEAIKQLESGKGKRRSLCH